MIISFILQAELPRVGMKRDQVLNEEERKRRFLRKDYQVGEENNIDEDPDDIDIADEIQSSEDEIDKLEFEIEEIACNNVKKVHQDLSEHSSQLDPVTGLINDDKENLNFSDNEDSDKYYLDPVTGLIEDDIEESEELQYYDKETSQKYCHKKFQHKEFPFTDQTQFNLKRVNIIDESQTDEKNIDVNKTVELEVDVINNETITISFNTRELENLYTHEESNYFRNALDFFKRCFHHTPAMTKTCVEIGLIFAKDTMNLPPNYFISCQNLTRLVKSTDST